MWTWTSAAPEFNLVNAAVKQRVVRLFDQQVVNKVLSRCVSCVVKCKTLPSGAHLKHTDLCRVQLHHFLRHGLTTCCQVQPLCRPGFSDLCVHVSYKDMCSFCLSFYAAATWNSFEIIVLNYWLCLHDF